MKTYYMLQVNSYRYKKDKTFVINKIESYAFFIRNSTL